uniref:Uncharacterized protein n=1 Tax=Aotus nancymaae TaxID=37293 RepID=A0A2K5C3M5_AOTNA
MEEDIKTKIKNYKTAPFDSPFPNQNQSRNSTAKEGDVSVCECCWRVYKSLCPMSWVTAWDGRRAEGMFPGKV